MKKQTVFCVDREKDTYRREIEDRLKNRPTFERFPEQVFLSMSYFKLR